MRGKKAQKIFSLIVILHKGRLESARLNGSESLRLFFDRYAMGIPHSVGAFRKKAKNFCKGVKTLRTVPEKEIARMLIRSPRRRYRPAGNVFSRSEEIT